MGVSPVATWQLLRLGPVDQCVGRSTGRRGWERLAPDDRALGTVAATGASDLILAGLRGRLARTQTTGALAHIATSFQFQATPGVEEKPPEGGSLQSQATPFPKKKPLWDGEGVSRSGNSLYFSLCSYKPPEIRVDFGTFIADLRDKKGFSLRELERRAGELSHVYIWRLEKGSRETPSQDTLEKLSKGLEIDDRDWELALLLLKTEIPDDLFALARARTDIPVSDIEPVATMSFRGSRPTDEAGWLRLIDFVKDI